MTRIEPHSPTRALVASFLFTDLVGFSLGSAAEQYAAKTALSAVLLRNLAALRNDDYRIKDTGDGAFIAFTANPEHALYMALAIADDFARAAAQGGFPSNSLRTGVHLGAVKEALDLEARPNFIGDGINAAKRVMDFAAPGQITASRAFFEAVACLDTTYAALFTHVGASDDKHGRPHDLYVIAPSAEVLQTLRMDLGAKPEPATRVADPRTHPGFSGATVRKWVMSVAAVAALGGAATLIATKVIDSQRSANAQGTTQTSAARALPEATITPTIPDTATKVDAAVPPTGVPPAEAPTARAAPAATQEVVTAEPPQAASVPGTVAGKTSAKVKSKPEATPSAPTATTAAARSSPRCSRIMEKATLGEALSVDEQKELASSCR